MPTTNVVDLRLDVFRFVAKKQASQKGSLFRLKFAMHIIPGKPEKGYVIFTDSLNVILISVIAII